MVNKNGKMDEDKSPSPNKEEEKAEEDYNFDQMKDYTEHNKRLIEDLENDPEYKKMLKDFSYLDYGYPKGGPPSSDSKKEEEEQVQVNNS